MEQEEQFKKWQEAFAPYETAVEKFAKNKGICVDKYYHESTSWLIGKIQNPGSVGVWCNLEFNYNDVQDWFYLIINAWLDRRYSVPEGEVHERRLVGGHEERLVGRVFASWPRREEANITTLLEKAYHLATSFTEKDLTKVSASIRGKDGIRRAYHPKQV
jgi:hypothetical protein